MGTEAGPADAPVELEVGPPAHGGHCVARLDGRVVFVRHAIPGERVLARVTEAGVDRRFWRADAVEILEASPDRVPSAWPEAGPGGVGGGELGHVALPAQRRWKAAVVTEALRRIGGIERLVEVEAVPGDDERAGLGWRTRVTLTTDERGRAGMYRYRTHDVVPVRSLPLASPVIAGLGLLERRRRPGVRIDAVAPVGGDRPLVLVDGAPERGERRSVREVVEVGGRPVTFRVSGTGFWQVHDGAPRLLVAAVLAGAGLEPTPEAPTPDAPGVDWVVDLYAGAGLFTVPLADAAGPGIRLDAVEGNAHAVRDARRNMHGRPQVVLNEGDVARVLPTLAAPPRGGRGVVVLDPPRAGAGPDVMAAVAALRPARVVYVACDPAALARDVHAAAGHGYGLLGLRAFDLFPHTHHVECVAVLEPA